MNWKQLYASATPAERLETLLLMLHVLEARPEIVIVYIDLRRILLRGAFLGILAMLTLTSAFITLRADPLLVAFTVTLYLAGFFIVCAFKRRKTAPLIQTAHYL